MTLIWIPISALIITVIFYLVRLYLVEKECPECGSNNVTKSQGGKLVCEDCGYVWQERKTDYEHEGKRPESPAEAQKTRRTGSPHCFKGQRSFELSTSIGKKETDAKKNPLPPTWRTKDKRLRKKQNKKTKTNREKKLYRAKKEMAAFASSLAGVLEEGSGPWKQAVQVLKKAQDAGLVARRDWVEIEAATLFHVIRKNDIPVTIGEIEEVTEVKKRTIRRRHTLLCRELGLKDSPVPAQAFVPRIADNLGLSGKVQARARKISNIAERNNQGKNKDAIAAASVKVSSDQVGKSISSRKVAIVTPSSSKSTINSLINSLCSSPKIP